MVVVGIEGTLAVVEYPLTDDRRDLEVVVSAAPASREHPDDGLATGAESRRCPPVHFVEHRLSRGPGKPTDEGCLGGCPVPQVYLGEVARGQPGQFGEEQKGVTLITPAEFSLALAFRVVEQRYQPLDFGFDIR